MAVNALQLLWAEPRPPHPPAHGWRDGALVVVLAAWSVAEVLLREETSWRPLVLAVSLVVALTLPWRRTHPLAAVAVAFGTLLAFDVARLVVVDATGLSSIAAVLLLPFALFRWGSGREAAIGLGIVLTWLTVTLAVTRTVEPLGVAEVVAGYGFFLFSSALGATLRLLATSRVRDIEQAQLRQRNQLARELHDTVGHHVSAIAVAAQAGRVAGAAHPEQALAALETIEDAASRTLEEMRAMVRVLRDDAEPELAPRPGLADLERLARSGGTRPRVEVQVSGALDHLSPAVGATLYRIAQESVTNALRHATHATEVVIRVVDEGDQVRLTVRDDGAASATGLRRAPGYGLLGMTERAALLRGSLHAGPSPEGGWTVEAVLPKQGVAV